MLPRDSVGRRFGEKDETKKLPKKQYNSGRPEVSFPKTPPPWDGEGCHLFCMLPGRESLPGGLGRRQIVPMLCARTLCFWLWSLEPSYMPIP